MRTFAIERYTAADLGTVIQFANTHFRVQQHIDWRSLRDILEDEAEFVFLAWNFFQLEGVLAFSQPREDMLWLRLAGLHNSATLNTFFALMAEAEPILYQHGIRRIFALELEYWFRDAIVGAGYTLIDELVHLERQANLPLAYPIHLEIMPATEVDLPVVLSIDHAAFRREWHMQAADLRGALEYSHYFTQALVDERVVGYQLATSYGDDLHLARLAVLPEMRGQGIGTQLVAELIQRHPHRVITVNTQASNAPALRVYEHLHFERRELRTPVWMKQL